MTPVEAALYTRNVIRLLTAIGAVALSACATASSASTPELLELKGAVRALREENARLEQRLSRLETRSAVAAAAAASGEISIGRATPAKAAPAIEPPADAAVPTLTVVKLKPKKEAAPKISTNVAMVEPSADVIEALGEMREPSQGAADDDGDPTVGDAIFEHGLSALKTGSVNTGIDELQKFAAESPKHGKADNALYFSGLGLMGLSEYEKAARAFEDVLARYPAGDAVLDSMLKLAECRVRLNRPKEARAMYERIVASYPGTAAATAAQTRLQTKLQNEPSAQR